MWARAEWGRVVELTDMDPDGRYPPDFGWMDISGLDPQPEVGWVYENGVFSPYVPPPIPDSQFAYEARVKREDLLRTVYDPGIMMAQRFIRMSSDPAEISYAEGKIVELDNFAAALQAIPDQEGWPREIIWPVVPTK